VIGFAFAFGLTVLIRWLMHEHPIIDGNAITIVSLIAVPLFFLVGLGAFDYWFYWAVGVAVGFPICLVLLTELQNALRRRGSFMARPVHLVRNYLLPLGAVLILLVGAMQISGEATPVRVVATVFGFVVLVLLLSGTNATLFQGAPQGSWRKRVPSIFLEVARFALIIVGVGLILAYIWGAHIGGLFTALGVSSIVLGLTLQNSVGQIIAGLFVLFEQPFQLGDWIETPSARGRVAGRGSDHVRRRGRLR